jgi:translation initiation factor 2B subunit (eIF-2B alpha/beta/delta family)
MDNQDILKNISMIIENLKKEEISEEITEAIESMNDAQEDMIDDYWDKPENLVGIIFHLKETLDLINKSMKNMEETILLLTELIKYLNDTIAEGEKDCFIVFIPRNVLKEIKRTLVSGTIEHTQKQEYLKDYHEKYGRYTTYEKFIDIIKNYKISNIVL